MEATATHSGGLGSALLFLLCVGALILLVVPGIGNVMLREHAVERHGADAITARGAVTNGSPQGRYDCPKSDKMYQVEELADGRWAVMIIGRASHLEITSFVTSDRRHLLKMLDHDGCEPTLRWLHP